MKHYVDIERFKVKYDECMRAGDEIVVQEKIDGANASFTYDPAQDKVLAFSRKNELNEANNLRGFWDWTQRLDKKGVAHMTQNGRYVIFGEWLVKHTVRYPEHEYNHFWMFDVWDTQDEKWLHYDDVRAIHAGLLSVAQLTQEVINFVPVFYDGPFISWDHLYQMVGRTDVNAEPCGEGIVIKNQNTIDIPEWRLPTYVKIVSEKFSEVHVGHAKKLIDPAVLAAREAERQMVATVVTERRVAKILEKFVDNGILPEDWDEKNMKDVAKNLPKAVYEDCIKEEPDIVKACEDFGKICGKISMDYVRQFLSAR
jgi:hypothetical protein